MDILKLILEIANNHSIWFMLSMVLMFTFCAFVYLGILLLKKKIENWNPFKENNSKNLLGHKLFQNLRIYLNYEIQHLVIGEKLREALFRDFLIFHFTCIKNEYTHFLERGDLEKMDAQTYKLRMMECQENIVKFYEEKAIREGIPDVVIRKYNEWNEQRIKDCYEYISNICDEQIFQTNTAKTAVIFDFMIHILNLTVISAKDTVIRLNGELDKVVYKGIRSEKVSGKRS